jgi:hypothetical protein
LADILIENLPAANKDAALILTANHPSFQPGLAAVTPS